MATSIGAVLCHWDEKPRDEHVDQVRWDDNDVRQEAAMRSLLLMRKLGFPEVGGDGTFEAALDEMDAANGGPSRCHRWAIGAAKRQLHGRGEASRVHATVRLGSGAEQDVLTDAEASERQRYLEDVADAAAEAELDAVDADLPTELRAVRERGKDFVRALQLMMLAQRLQALGIPMPPTLRMALRDARRATGLALDVDML